VLVVVLVLSVLANFFLFMMLVGMAAFFSIGHRGIFVEEVIEKGPRTSKIAVINLAGVITKRQAEDIRKQLTAAREDKTVKGVILRVNSPGGTISASDQIYNELRKWREETHRPAIAFMEGVAASGGYYASVACDKIVAEPTAITGSIGVIMSYFVLEELLENKLGIKPVVVKGGARKDWPSLFKTPSPEQLQYLDDKLIKPAHKRFKEIVTDSRESLTAADVNELADGSIYGASEALEAKLIDAVGYLDKATEVVKELAGIDEATVVEYRRAFSFYDFLGAKTSTGFLRLDKTRLFELNTPEAFYLWSGY